MKHCTCPDIPDIAIHKIAVAVVEDRKLLIVRKKGLKEYISLGGVHDGDETHEKAAQREALEELQIEVSGFIPLGRFEEIAVGEKENIPLILDVYLAAKYFGTPSPDMEIKEYLWIDKNYAAQNIKIASGLEKFIIPRLIAEGKM